MLDVVMMAGRGRGIGVPRTSTCSWGEVPSEGPLGVEVRERRMAGVDREASFWRASARSFSCIRLVRSDRREVRFGRESTRWNMSFSSALDRPSSVSESSQASSSSSSSIALSETSSSSLSITSSFG